MANVFDNMTGIAHVVCESSLLKATTTGHMYSLKCHENLDNGSIVSVGSWVESQVFNSKDFAAGETAVLILTPPLAYNSDRRTYQQERYFYNAANEIARGYELHIGDIWTVSENAFSTADGTVAPAVGKFIDADYTVTATAGTAGLVGEIVEEVTHFNNMATEKAYRIVLRALLPAAVENGQQG